MDILNVSVDVAATCFKKDSVFYTKQGEWTNGATIDVIVSYHAKSIGSEIVLSRCECKVGDLDLLSDNKCQTDDDAITMALNAV